MNWNKISQIDQIDQIKQESFGHPVLIYKHSARCSVSSIVANRLERAWLESEIPTISTYHLDLIQHRAISHAIAHQFGVAHESPQILIIVNEACTYHRSHMNIVYHDIKRVVEQLTAM